MNHELKLINRPPTNDERHMYVGDGSTADHMVHDVNDPAVLRELLLDAGDTFAGLARFHFRIAGRNKGPHLGGALKILAEYLPPDVFADVRDRLSRAYRYAEHNGRAHAWSKAQHAMAQIRAGHRVLDSKQRFRAERMNDE